MKNRLAIYSKLVKTYLIDEGCIFINQKSDTTSNSVILKFDHKFIPESTINRLLQSLNCIYRMEYGKDNVTILLQEEV